MSTTANRRSDAASEAQQVRGWVSRVTLILLALLTVASIANIHDMAEATHAANGIAAWIVSIAIGGTLSVLAYVASITDGRTRTTAVVFASFAALVSTALQVSLFQSRGAQLAVALAFGVGVPFFEVALALTDSMLRRYALPVSQPVAPAATPARTPARKPSQPVAAPVAPAAPHATPETPEDTRPDSDTDSARDISRMSVSQLAQHLNVSRSTIYRRIQNGELTLNGATGD